MDSFRLPHDVGFTCVGEGIVVMNFLMSYLDLGRSTLNEQSPYHYYRQNFEIFSGKNLLIIWLKINSTTKSI